MVEENIGITLGKRIKERRKLLRITQQELAEKVDVDAKYISRIETGNSNPSLNTLEKIAKVMHTEVSSLFRMDEVQGKDEIIKNLTDKLKDTSIENVRTIYEISEKIISTY